MSATPITVTAAARRLGMSNSRVRKICQDEGIGTLLTGRLRVLSEADLRRISAARRPRGNPNWLKKKLAKKSGRKS